MSSHCCSCIVIPASSSVSSPLYRHPCIVVFAPSFLHRNLCIIIPTSSFLHRNLCIVIPISSFLDRYKCIIAPHPPQPNTQNE
ncbi:MAG: hypothetical protein LBF01_04715, partial [Bacteroidales bacterium]|nr:hypothetical protein [Bacteroidales bacterium]